NLTQMAKSVSGKPYSKKPISIQISETDLAYPCEIPQWPIPQRTPPTFPNFSLPPDRPKKELTTLRDNLKDIESRLIN
ncbi:MAG: hypothetical protein KBD41_13345, partial [Saprospiraceae bacterium]|nr:hypothetical protein [Saprospiraceae bacterium]